MTTLTVLGASRLRAKEIGDAEQVHHIDEHVKEAVVASAKVGLDILLSIGISKMTEPFIEHRLDELKNKYAGDPNGYQKALYRNIHGLATVGSGLLSTNLGVSFARTMLREYSTVRHQGGGQINGPDGEPLTYANGNPVYGRYAKGEGGEILHDEDGMPIIHEDGDPVVDEEGRPVIDWKKFYYNVATVADLTGDAAISFHPLIASGDIAPREVVQQKIGWDNLHKVSLNAVPKRVFNTLVGFKMPNKVFNFLARRRHEKTPVDVNGADDIMFTREELEAFTERTNGFERAYRKAFEGHPSRLREAFRNSGRHKVESVQENFQDQADRLHDIWKVYVQDFKNSVKKGDQENVVDVSDELVPGHKGRTHVDQYGGLTLLADMAKKIPGVGPHVGPALHMLEQMSHLPVNFKTVHHAAGSTLAEALNLLPYQLLNAAPTSGVVHHMLNDLRISEPEPKTWKDSSIGELFMQNASMHLILEVLSGVADNGFSVSVGLNTIISDTRKLLEEGKTQEASDYFTLETQKIFDAGQAGGGGGLPGCSAHFNALSFSDIPMLETYKVGTPSFLGLYLAANAISATLAKNGLMPARLDMSPVAAASGAH